MMITKMSKANKHYNIKELCKLFDISRSSYYYQVKDKVVDNNTTKIISSIKRIAIESRHTYGKRRMQIMLNKQGFKIGTYKTATLMKQAGVIAIRPRKNTNIAIMSQVINIVTIYYSVHLLKQR